MGNPWENPPISSETDKDEQSQAENKEMNYEGIQEYENVKIKIEMEIERLSNLIYNLRTQEGEKKRMEEKREYYYSANKMVDKAFDEIKNGNFKTVIDYLSSRSDTMYSNSTFSSRPQTKKIYENSYREIQKMISEFANIDEIPNSQLESKREEVKRKYTEYLHANLSVEREYLKPKRLKYGVYTVNFPALKTSNGAYRGYSLEFFNSFEEADLKIKKFSE